MQYDINVFVPLKKRPYFLEIYPSLDNDKLDMCYPFVYGCS